jgi:nickel-dependent lactate racemase
MNQITLYGHVWIVNADTCLRAGYCKARKCSSPAHFLNIWWEIFHVGFIKASTIATHKNKKKRLSQSRIQIDEQKCCEVLPCFKEGESERLKIHQFLTVKAR